MYRKAKCWVFDLTLVEESNTDDDDDDAGDDDDDDDESEGQPSQW